MKRVPPHLPAPFCNIRDHQTMQRIKIILAAAVFGLLGGLAGASMMLGWIWQDYTGGDIWTVAQNSPVNTHVQLDERVRNEKVEGRIVKVYDKSSTVAGVSYLAEGDKIGDAIIIGSDGWLAMYYPNHNDGFKNWRVLMSDGTVYSLQNVLFDKYAGVVYLKLAKSKDKGQDSIQLNNLVDYRDAQVGQGDEIFVNNQGYWRHTVVMNSVVEARKIPHLDTAPITYFVLDNSFPSGSVAVNAQGRVVGLVVEKGLLMPIDYMARIVPGVLSQQKISYPTLGIEGWYSTEEPIVVKNNVLSGFAVTKVVGKGTQLKAGDVIIEAGGKVVDGSQVWYNTDQVIRLKVWRGGKALELEAKPFEVN